ncbi:aminoacyl--tRNA ligase-related protein [Xanthomonas oryzae]|nr:aminoacyl--tRNA ligase-related protein [Xanthomonas oryzae]QBH04064.1 hypothetical protein EYC57_12610 [Xanthomonas oryzae]
MLKRTRLELAEPLPEAVISVLAYKGKQFPGLVGLTVDPADTRRITISHVPSASGDDLAAAIRAESAKLFGGAKSSRERDGQGLRTLREAPVGEDVAAAMLERSWMFPLPCGDIAYGAPVVALLRAFDRLYVETVGAELPEAEELQFSPMISMPWMREFGYLRSNPAHLFVAAAALTTPLCGCAHEGDDHTTFGLQTAPCLKVYPTLADKQLDSDRTFLVIGPCFRNEGSNVRLLERLRSFTMREFVFVGSEAFVRRMNASALRATIRWLDEIGMSGYVEEAQDPFFIEAADKKKHNVPENVKQEVRAHIPTAGTTISVASFDSHGNFFADKFKIGFGGAAAFSGCIGVGLERVVWSFLHQVGLDESGWPDCVREAVRKR